MTSKRAAARTARMANVRNSGPTRRYSVDGDVTLSDIVAASNGASDDFSAALLLPGDDNVYARWEYITPELAKQYLVYNTHNRNLRPMKVDAYAADMLSGDWRQTGDPIQFGVTDAGDIVQLNGAHRLNAIIQSGTAQWMLVVHGLAMMSQATMDTGLPRRFTDHLRLSGEINFISLATAVRSILLWELGDSTFTGSMTTTTPQLIDCLARHGWLRDEINYLTRINKYAKLPVSANAALYHVFNQVNTEDAQYFWERLISDEEHLHGDPIFMLRKALLNNSKEVRGRRNVKHLTALTIKAWNKYRHGETVQQLTFKPGGANPEKFPVIDGLEPGEGDE